MASTINASTSPAAIIQTADGTGILALQTGNTTALTIDASQNVGIGTASPSVKLDVNNITGWAGGTTGIVSNITGVNAPTASGGNLRVLASTTQAADVGGSIVLGGYYIAQTSSVDYADLSGRKENSTGGNTAGYMTFGTRPNAGNMTEQMRIDSAGLLKFNSGYGSVATAYGCRTWVNFNGTGTVAIRASGNVSSITDNGTGDYTVNFTTAMPDVNYSVVQSANFNQSTTTINTALIRTQFTSACSIACHDVLGATQFDCQIVTMAVFR